MTFVGEMVSWQSRLQKCVVLSTTETKRIEVTEAYKNFCGWKNSNKS